MNTPWKTILRTLLSLAGAALIVAAAAADPDPLFQRIKNVIWLDMVFQAFPPFAFRLSVGLTGLYLLAVPWLSAWLGRLRAGFPESGKTGDRSFLLFAASLTVAVVLFIHWFVLQGVMFTPDEYAYLFQARIFAAGRLFADAHPLQEFFQAPFIASHEGRLFSIFPHGWSLIMIPAVWMGVPWLLNPLLGALTLVLLYRFGVRHYDRRTARWAVGIVLFSPFFLFNNATGLSHSASLFLAVLILMLILGKRGDGPARVPDGRAPESQDRPLMREAQPARSLAIGALSGLLAVTHHLDLFFLVPAIGYFALRRFEIKAAVLRSVCMAIGLALPLALLFWIWARQTGAFFTTPITLYVPTTDFLGFVPEDGSVFTFSRGGEAIGIGLRHTKQWLLMLGVWIFPGALLFLLPLLGLKRTVCDWLILAGLASLSMGYFFYHSPGGWQYGPRFFYPALPGLALLIAKGGLGFPSLMTRLFRRPMPGAWVPLAMVGLILMGDVMIGGGLGALMRYATENAMRPMRAIREAGAEPAILFLDFEDKSSGPLFNRNSPGFDDSILCAMDLGARNRELMDCYPDRRFFRMEAGTIGEVCLMPEKVRWYEITPSMLDETEKPPKEDGGDAP